MKKVYDAPKVETFVVNSEDILFDSNEGGWAPLRYDEEESEGKVEK